MPFWHNDIVYIGLPKVVQTEAESPSTLERFAVVSTTLCNGAVIHIGVGFEVAYLYVVASSKARTVR